MTPVDILRARLARDPADAEAWYALGILLLEGCLEEPRPSDLVSARDAFTRSIELGRESAWSHAAIGFTRDLDDEQGASALFHFAEARRLDPKERIFDVYVLTLLVETGAEKEAMTGLERAAIEQGVDLAALREELRSAGMPVTANTLLTNGFIHARNFFVSCLRDESERVGRVFFPDVLRRKATLDADHCVEEQRRLRHEFDAQAVPESCQPLSSWACRLGVGDDPCRAFLLAQLSESEREELLQQVRAHGDAVVAWLDSFGDRPMPAEPAAMMYLLSAAEELGA